MSPAYLRADERYAWHGQSLLITTARGDCGAENALTGLYFRETRHLRTLRLVINGEPPWLCESATDDPSSLHFSYVYPEVARFGGGGTGKASERVDSGTRDVPHRAIDILVAHHVGIATLDIVTQLGNRSIVPVDLEITWLLDADFADIQEATDHRRAQSAPIVTHARSDAIEFVYDHDQLEYRSVVSGLGDATWRGDESGLHVSLHLEPQQTATLTLHVRPIDYQDAPNDGQLADAERLWQDWQGRFVRVTSERNRVVQDIVQQNLRDLASYPLLQGNPDEWLAPQAGMPVYPALFGRDAMTAGWQAGWVEGFGMLEASLTRLGRMQGVGFDAWRDEEPGRIPYQVRQGPLARLNINPYAAYYADFASPMMFIIALAHYYAWTGDARVIERHWDVARRILDWLRERGDRDGDGYLEYLTVSPKGTKNQGWKDSDNAILYEDGEPVPAPIGTCELQGYWFASLQMMSAMSWVRGDSEDAKALWHEAADLKQRFNRDWWIEDQSYFGVALDPDKRLVKALTSNVGQCIATGIVDDEHLPRVVARMFAPDLFSGWGVRTLSSNDRSYNPVEYHLGSVWAVENASIVFGLARFGFRQRASQLAEGLFALAKLYPGYRIPETVGGYARSDRFSPGAYPRSNTPQLWNATVFPMLLQSILGLQPFAPLSLLVVDPYLPEWLGDITIEDLTLGDARATLRCWRDDDGDSHAEIVRKTGSIHLLRQPPLESLRDGIPERLGALVETLLHH